MADETSTVAMERKGRGSVPRPTLQWNTNTALAVIVLSSMVTIAMLRGSLAKGGGIQP